VQTPEAGEYFFRGAHAACAPTHAFDMEQRLVAMNFRPEWRFERDSSAQRQHRPAGLLHAFYPEFFGVPSVAQFVQLTPAQPTSLPPDDHEPCKLMRPSQRPVHIFFRVWFDPDGTITAYSWSFGRQSEYSSLATPGNVIYKLGGTFAATLTVTDTRSYRSKPPRDTSR